MGLFYLFLGSVGGAGSQQVKVLILCCTSSFSPVWGTWP